MGPRSGRRGRQSAGGFIASILEQQRWSCRRRHRCQRRRRWWSWGGGLWTNYNNLHSHCNIFKHDNQLMIRRVSEIGGTVRRPRPRTRQTLGRSPPQSSVVGAPSAYPPPFSSVLVPRCHPIIPYNKIQPGGGANNNQSYQLTGGETMQQSTTNIRIKNWGEALLCRHLFSISCDKLVKHTI